MPQDAQEPRLVSPEAVKPGPWGEVREPGLLLARAAVDARLSAPYSAFVWVVNLYFGNCFCFYLKPNLLLQAGHCPQPERA